MADRQVHVSKNWRGDQLQTCTYLWAEGSGGSPCYRAERHLPRWPLQGRSDALQLISNTGGAGYDDTCQWMQLTMGFIRCRLTVAKSHPERGHGVAEVAIRDVLIVADALVAFQEGGERVGGPVAACCTACSHSVEVVWATRLAFFNSMAFQLHVINAKCKFSPFKKTHLKRFKPLAAFVWATNELVSRQQTLFASKMWLVVVCLKTNRLLNFVLVRTVAFEMYRSQQRVKLMLRGYFSHRSASARRLLCPLSSGIALQTLPSGHDLKYVLQKIWVSLWIRRSVSSVVFTLSREQILRVKEPAKLVPVLLLVENRRLLHFRLVYILSV